jgi:TPR repeat protein
VVVFGAMSFAQGVGDHHPGHRLPFWQHACDQNLDSACTTLANIEATMCARGSGWACNEHGLLMFAGRAGSPRLADSEFQRACALGTIVGCQNAAVGQRGGTPQPAVPQAADFAIVLREGKGELPDHTPFALFTRACNSGWMTGCERLAAAYMSGQGTPQNHSMAAREFSRACDGGVASACSDVGYMYKTGDGVDRDDTRALGYLKKACTLGMAQACRWLEEQQRQATN